MHYPRQRGRSSEESGDGTVRSEYAEDKLVDVEIIDKDSDDGDRLGLIGEAVKELGEDVEKGMLVSVY